MAASQDKEYWAKHVKDIDLDAILREGNAVLLDGYLNSQYFRGKKRHTNKVQGSTESRRAAPESEHLIHELLPSSLFRTRR